jgi:hypothetical protein
MVTDCPGPKPCAAEQATVILPPPGLVTPVITPVAAPASPTKMPKS